MHTRTLFPGNRPGPARFLGDDGERMWGWLVLHGDPSSSVFRKSGLLRLPPTRSSLPGWGQTHVDSNYRRASAATSRVPLEACPSLSPGSWSVKCMWKGGHVPGRAQSPAGLSGLPARGSGQHPGRQRPSPSQPQRCPGLSSSPCTPLTLRDLLPNGEGTPSPSLRGREGQAWPRSQTGCARRLRAHRGRR